jgi:peptidoglycan/xylan/chitin deacetylase (PgdA/CDA1 family)
MISLRPVEVIVGLAIVLGVFVIGIGIYAVQSDDTNDTVDPTATPEIAEAPPEEEVVESDDAVDLDGEAEQEEPTQEPEEAAEQTDEATPEEEPEPADTGGGAQADDDTNGVSEETYPTLTDEELQEYQPNELGQIMVLMYHVIEHDADPDEVYSRTPDQFRGDLQWLYDNDFYVIPIGDYIRNEIRAPAGKRPVVLTFDDGTVGQFRFIEQDDGSMAIDPDSAIGILEDFFTRYDDFGRGGLFSILPNSPFAWPDAEAQMPYAEEKLQWLIDNGYELGNHTVGHVNLRESSDDEIKSELARAIDMITDYAPEAEVDVLAVPFGVYPEGGDTSIFEGWEYEGRQYSLAAALMVGAEPGPSPVHSDFDPMWIPRINADDEQLGRWFSFVEENPGIMYVSDGNPDTITIPEDVHPWLVDTFDEAKAEGKNIIRY